MLRRLTLLTLLITLALLPPAARAQEREPTAFLQAVDTSDFPDISVRLTVSDSTGRSIRGLGAGVMALTEDEAPVTGLEVVEEEVGVQVVFVLNATIRFSSRDVLGNTRLDYLKQALLRWAGEEGAMRAGLDDVTLLTPEGAWVQHTSSPREFQAALEAYTPEYADEETGFQLLQLGLTFAADPAPRPGMRRVVVLISTPLRSVNDVPVADAASRANELHIPIYTVLVGAPEDESLPGAENLQRLAELTGAAYTYFAAPEAMLPIYDLIASQRTHYLLSFRSVLATPGRHRLSAMIVADGLNVVTPPVEFALTLEPPAVAFVTPPTALTRRSSDPTLTAARLPPTSQSLAVIIEFPDGYSRAITRSQLFVDDVLADERLAPPFDRFTWDLTGYESGGTHRLRVVVEDDLGLAGATIEHPVTIEVVIERSQFTQVEPFMRPLAILAGILLAGVFLALLVTVYLRRPRRREVVRERPPPAAAPAPVATSVPVRPRRGKAYLEVVAGEHETGGSVELADEVVTLGRDGAQVQAAFADRSVSRRHARIVQNGEGDFLLYDEDSTSGTWLNLEPVTSTGAPLRHGDRINLGRVQLIFHLRAAELEKTPPPRPVSVADTSPTLPRPDF